MTVATRIAGKLAALGGWIHVVLLDLALCLEPRLAVSRPLAFRTAPWLGLLLLFVLSVGLTTIGIGGFEATRAVVARLTRPEQQP